MRKKTNAKPSVGQLEAEIQREDQRRRFGRALRSTIYILITVAATAVLISTLVLPVLKIYGNSMTPVLREGEIVVALKHSDFQQGEIVALYYNNKILVKRVICGPGDWINILDDGTVVVNGNQIEEPYLSEKDKGICDLELPYQVPEGQYFVMGDQRVSSVDSRSSSVGCIPLEQFVGKIIFRVWPMDSFGTVK